jgi:hypothetical protein
MKVFAVADDPNYDCRVPRTCVAVVGPGENASATAIADATTVGRLVAERGWVTLTGGRAVGVMAAATRGAADAGGLTIGVLPGTDKRHAAPDVAVALATGLGEARNAVLVSAADAVIACGMSNGTASEVALALRAAKLTVLVRPDADTRAFFSAAHICDTPEQAVEWLEPLLCSG